MYHTPFLLIGNLRALVYSFGVFCIHQGDSLSPPFFFYYVMKVYLVLSHRLIEMVLYEGFSLSKRNPILITHLLFANDTFLFCMINRNDCQKVLNILETYDRILSQQVNGIEEKFPSFSINLLLRIWRRKFKRCWELGSHRIFFLKKN